MKSFVYSLIFTITNALRFFSRLTDFHIILNGFMVRHRSTKHAFGFLTLLAEYVRGESSAFAKLCPLVAGGLLKNVNLIFPRKYKLSVNTANFGRNFYAENLFI